MEKSNKESTNRYRVWLDQASYDLEAAKKSLEAGFYEWVCYQSIQSVEKMVKGVIVHSGFRPPRVHKLGVLLGMANKAKKAFEDVKLNFRKIESYTFISRYPFVIPGQNKTPHDQISKQEAENCITLAEDMLKKINDFLYGKPPSSSDNVIETERYFFKKEEIDKRLENVINLILNCEQLEVKKIILFGSFAREKTQPRTSTMDILVVANTELPFMDRIGYVREKTRGSEPIIEPLIYTETEFDQLLNEEGEGFLESALEEGKVIWPRNN